MTVRTEIPYVGSELQLFARATNWKRYLSRRLRPYIGENVIEVGAGLGSSTKYLCDRLHSHWLCLDPDPKHVSYLASRIAAGHLLPCCKARCGILADLSSDHRADTIIYVDVLEHIEDDEQEMRVAAAHLTAGGHVVALSPAFNFLYSPFDKAIGHCRRYEPKDAGRLTVHSMVLQRMFFLDSLGFFAYAFNRLVTRAVQPSIHQIQVWDKAIVPVSVFTDKIFGQLFGKSIVMIWQKI